jgi:hypothetical protein
MADGVTELVVKRDSHAINVLTAIKIMPGGGGTCSATLESGPFMRPFSAFEVIY